ncbi:pantoate--beta-alanine ligase [candidate division WOR-3 bacterium]|uniref:Pantothenate synthetase n=1 Tax=candidate division WOR-3 bacterium TaxID=2052148 RepID=A0A9D5K8Q0_UNCW3|nr:pantoate--beta-alanine ligase [candidate division WOR-3 bacterium]MBD3364397.1 pantoate--beta-alanine ligase [candidate division WOR-3 bacterium]
MEIVRTVHEMQTYSDEVRAQGSITGLVPTMGYLHEGHLSLVRRAREDADIVIVSIFVNPTQFGPGEDLSTYPRDFESDVHLLEKENADVIFNPAVSGMYPEPSLTNVYVHKLTQGLCGADRPGHFEGVALVVAKLLNIVKPHKAFFGAKDFQQQAVIRRMVTDLNFDVEIVTCPVVRERDGLAMSSRNMYLTSDERERAAVLNQSLEEAERLIKEGERSVDAILNRMRTMIQSKNPVKIDYVSAVDPDTLEPVTGIRGPVLLAVAVRFGKARLVDNRLVEP